MIPVLDRGYVKLIGASPDQSQMLYVSSLLSGRLDDKTLALSNVLLEVKCPLFIRVQLTDLGFKTLSCRSPEELEAYIPVQTDIRSASMETDQELQASIQQTTEALLLNVKGYVMDGCDRQAAQVIAPVSTYTTVLVQTDLATLMVFFKKKGLSNVMNLYRKAFLEAAVQQWKDIKTICQIEVK